MDNRRPKNQQDVPKWRQTFWGRLWRDDRPFAIVMTIVLVVYATTAILRLEIFPCYLYAMYSVPVQAPPDYTTYEIISHDQSYLPSDMDYRYYTYLMNTVSQYDGILINDSYHPEAKYLDKYVAAAGLTDSPIHRWLRNPYEYDDDALTSTMTLWLSKSIRELEGRTLIVRNTWSWISATPIISQRDTIYDQLQ